MQPRSRERGTGKRVSRWVTYQQPIGPSAASDTAPVRRRAGPLQWAGRIVLGVVALILAAWLILYITKGRFLKHPFEWIATRTSGRAVTVGGDFNFYFDIIDAKFLAERLRVANPGWAGPRPFFAADRIEANFATLTFVFGGRRVNWVELQGGAIDLEWDKARQRNSWTFAQTGKPLELPNVVRAVVDGTTIRYRDPKMQLGADIAVRTIRAQGREVMNAVRFAGTGTARATPFSVEGALLSPNQTIAGGRTKLALTVHAARTVADIDGTLPGATQIEGADLRIDVRGRNIADLFAVAGIAVPETRAYRLRSALTKRGRDWRFTGLRGRFGDSDLSGRLIVAMTEPRMKLTADLATHTLDIVDVAPFIGYNPDRVAAMGAKGAVTMVGGAPRLLPDAPLRVDALRNFDADVHYAVRQVRAKSLPVANIDLKLALDDRLLTLSPLTFDMARGHVDGDIAINARRPAVVTDYDIRLSPTPMGVLLAGFGVEQSGTTGTLKARIKMTGTGNSVHDSLSSANGRIAIIMPRGSFWARNVQLSELDFGTYVYKLFQGKLKEPVQINCGLIGFTVRNGIAAADPILIDTAKNVMVGRGGFSFRNETMDLAFRADGKKFSLFSGQSPVSLGGYFARPDINPISGDLFLRGGAAVGLGVIASPLASVLAFVDIGDAKAAACGPVLAGARASAQRTTKGAPRDDVGRGTTAKSENGNRTPDQKKAQRKKFLGIF